MQKKTPSPDLIRILKPLKIGGDDETRTHYLDNANVALYQMSYAPERNIVRDENIRKRMRQDFIFLKNTFSFP